MLIISCYKHKKKNTSLKEATFSVASLLKYPFLKLNYLAIPNINDAIVVADTTNIIPIINGIKDFL